MALPVVPNNWLFTLFIYLFNIFPIMAKRMTLRDYCTTNGYNMKSPVRANKNQYKYITLLHSDNPDNPENLYLGIEFGESVAVGDKLTWDLYVTDTKNAEGEARFKLTNKEGDATATLIANGYDLM